MVVLFMSNANSTGTHNRLIFLMNTFVVNVIGTCCVSKSVINTSLLTKQTMTCSKCMYTFFFCGNNIFIMSVRQVLGNIYFYFKIDVAREFLNPYNYDSFFASSYLILRKCSTSSLPRQVHYLYMALHTLNLTV